MAKLGNYRGPGRIATITYPQIAEWTGLTLATVRTYASRGIMDTDSVESIIAWVNTRRVHRGWPLIGQPAEKTEVDTLVSGNHRNDVTNLPVTSSGYNSRRGGFESW